MALRHPVTEYSAALTNAWFKSQTYIFVRQPERADAVTQKKGRKLLRDEKTCGSQGEVGAVGNDFSRERERKHQLRR